MIHFTDMTGLASSAVAIVAALFLLPGVVRITRPYLAILACAVAIAVLIPFGGLPPAAYVRGVIGDLSITSLVLLMLAIIRSLFAVSPNNESSAPYPFGVISDLVALPPNRMARNFTRKLGWKEDGGRHALLFLIAIAALGLYPLALGISLFDPYRLGYGNLWFVGVLLLVALAACFSRLPVAALCIVLAVFAWGVGWYESNNLWDYLLDPLLAIYATSALMRRSVRILLKKQ